MAALTWRNVDAPNLSGAVDGVRTASMLLNNAVATGRQGVEDYRLNQERTADRNLLNYVQGIQDPVAMQQAMASDARLRELAQGASIDTLRAVDRRPGNLLDNALQTQRIDQQGTRFADEQTQLRDAIAGRDAALRIAPDSPTGVDARAGLEASNLSPGAQIAAMNALQGMGFGQLYGPAGTGGGRVPPAAGSVPLGSGGGAGTRQGNAYDTVLGFGQFGLPSKPVTSMTMNEAIDFGRNTLIPATRNNAQLGLSGGKGSSAIGAYQFTQQTLQDYAPRVLGKDWASQPMSAENQDKIAEALFNDRKAGNLKDTWAGLPNSARGAYKDVSWEQMKPIIMQAEVGQTDPGQAILSNVRDQASVSVRTENNIQGINQQLAQNQSNNVSAVLDRLSADTKKSPIEVVNELVSEGTFTGSDRGVLLDSVQWMANNSGGRVNPAMAGEILKRNVGSENTWIGEQFSRMFTNNTPNLGNGLRINDRGAIAMMDAYLNRATTTQAASDRNLESELGTLQRLQTEYQQADETYRSMANSAIGRSEGYQRNVERYRLARDRAAEALEAANRDVESRGGGTTGNWNTTTPETITPVGRSVNGQVTPNNGRPMTDQERMNAMLSAW